MFANRYTALIDACSLLPALQKNILLSLAEAEFFRIRWSPKIIEETHMAFLKIYQKRYGDDTEEKAGKAIEAMNSAFPEAMLDDDLSTLISMLQSDYNLPDPDDAHVIAAAIKCRADIIITENLKDFPVKVLNSYNMEAKSADAFIADAIGLAPEKAYITIRKMRLRLNNPAFTPETLYHKMEKSGLTETATILKDAIELI